MTPGFNEPLPLPPAPYSLDLLRGHAPCIHRPHSCHVTAKQTALSSALSQQIYFITSIIFPCALSEDSSNSHCDLLCLCCCTSETGTRPEPPVPICLMWFWEMGWRTQGFLEQRMCCVLHGCLPRERMVVEPCSEF